MSFSMPARNLLEFDMTIGEYILDVWYYIFNVDMGSWNTIRHSNSDYEIHVIISGSCSFETEEKKYTLSEGDILIIRPGHYHASGATSDDFLRFTVNFNLDKDPFAGQERTGVVFSEASEETLLFCRLFQKECERIGLFKKEMVLSLLKTAIISSWRDIFGSINEAHDLEDPLLLENRISVIDRYFQANYARTSGEDELAEILHISRRQLVRVLKESYGKSFRERLLEARMEQASWLLKTTGEKAGEIASEVGYGSEASFYRAFKAYFGLTPAEYREKPK
ncbi:MAG: AraC family transcriptional regulator [Lachnospiraceae bacterium]|nr:AraC family transcriptional regulator [Lachnospiraceae bacterium]